MSSWPLCPLCPLCCAAAFRSEGNLASLADDNDAGSAAGDGPGTPRLGTASKPPLSGAARFSSLIQQVKYRIH